MSCLIVAWTFGGMFAAYYTAVAVLAWRRHRRRTGGNSR